MKLRHNDIIVPTDFTDPFSNCKLERKKYADVLTSIVGNYADGFVLAINNPWGEGKTTFVKMWRQHLINKEFNTLYYNAWENDFENDVLVALISELSEIEDKPESEFKVVLEKVLPLLGKLIPSILKHLVKRKLGDDASADLAELFGDYTADQLKEATTKYTSRKKSIEEFRQSLEVFANEAGNGKPLVFIIDELDRCRPSYAVEVLEQIKHLFAVPGIVFVLSIDKEQLGNAVRGVYGSDRLDADEYLKRFIDLEYSLPKPNIENYINYLYNYFDLASFIDSSIRKGVEVFQTDNQYLKRYSIYFFSSGFTLRQIEKIFARISITLKTFRNDHYIFPQLLILLAYLKEQHFNIYKNVSGMNYTIQEIVDEIEPILSNFINRDSERSIIALEAIFIKFYYNGYVNKNRLSQEELVEYVDGKYVINFNSKLEGETNALGNMIQHYNNDMHIYDSYLSFLIERFDLTQDLIRQ